MRILYDGMIYNMQAVGGINRYFANLIAGLPPDFIPYLTTCWSREVNFPTHPNLKVYRFRRFYPQRVSYRLEKVFFDYVVASGRIDVAHPTYYTLLSRRDLSEYRCPVVLTVQDMIHEIFPARMDPTGSQAEQKRKAILAADAIICGSENTKQDLLERYRLADKIVTVIYHGTGLEESLSHGPEPVPSRRYFLYVGFRYDYKNFDGLLRAFAKAHSTWPATTLCVLGAPFDEVESKLIADLRLDDAVENYGRVTDAHLAKLYRCSVAFVYPSLYEGFGLPLLEAMACGAPVIASNSSSMPEVVGDAGLLFDPASSDNLTDSLRLLLEDEGERERLIAKGRRRAREFSWNRTVAQTLDIYRTVSRSDGSSEFQDAEKDRRL